MDMTRGQTRSFGLITGAAGIGLLSWALYPTIARSFSGTTPVSVRLIPNPPVAGQAFAVSVTAQGAAGAQIAAQGCVIESSYGVVGGHLWASAGTAAQINAQYFSVLDSTAGTPAQQAAAAEDAVAAASQNPANRLGTANAASDGSAAITLYSSPLAAGTYTIMVFVAKSPSGLIVSDPVGTKQSALQRAPAAYLAMQVQVGQS